MKILFAGGGSIGHVAPCVAVWRALQEMEPTAEAHMICSEKKEDAEFLRKEGLPLTAIPAWKLLRQSPLQTMRAFRMARKVIDDVRPDVVFCKGGAVSVPVAWAAKRKRIPIVLHESDAVRGRANRLITRWASAVCIGFPQEAGSDKRVADSLETDAKRYPLAATRSTSRSIFTGNPIRPTITQGSRDRGLALTGLSGSKPILLVSGGSQGAVALNEAVIKHIDALLELCDVVHLTGKGKKSTVQRRGYWSAEFAHDELKDLYAIADMALSRAGAGSIAELAACGIPSILVPLPGLAQDHQTANARAAERSGGCVVLSQDQLMQTLLPAVRQLAADRNVRIQMSAKIRSLQRGDAARSIAEIIRSAAEKS